MDGILNILKPPGMTSFDVVALLRGLLETRKIGHAGTLDPMAAGVLPVCAGRATRAIEFMMDKDKLYRAELTLGVTTDTQDSSGKVLSSCDVNCSDNEIIDAIGSFTGSYKQVPPMYSALRVGGKRLYELAREGAEIERQSREVSIFSSEVADIDRSDGTKVLFDVHCSKGTYIRTLCADIGERLGCGGHMSFLLRKRAGAFDLASSYTLERLAEMKDSGTIQNSLTGIDSVFIELPRFELNSDSEKKFKNGMAVPASDSAGTPGSLIRVYDTSGRFIALGYIKDAESGNYLKVKKFF